MKPLEISKDLLENFLVSKTNMTTLYTYRDQNDDLAQKQHVSTPDDIVMNYK